MQHMPSLVSTHTNFNSCLPATIANMDTSQWGKMPAEQMKRTKYVIACLQGHSTHAAMRIAGARGKNYPSSVLKHLVEHGSLAEAVHHRAPSKHTDDVLAQAMQELVDNEDQPMNEPEFIEHLQCKDVLQAPTDSARFFKAFKAYVRRQGHTLSTHDTETTFAIKEQTAAERLRVSKELLHMMETSVPLENWIFEDETTIEESPHPKGEVAVHAHVYVWMPCWTPYHNMNAPACCCTAMHAVKLHNCCCWLLYQQELTPHPLHLPLLLQPSATRARTCASPS